MKKLMKWFVGISVGIFTLGFVINITNGESDMYQLWFMLVFISGWYLWEKRFE